MGVVALVLACLLFAPQADSDDFPFPSSTGTLSTGLETFTAMEDNGSDSPDNCLCPVCMEALGESFAPMVFPPQAGELYCCASQSLVSSLYCPEIFRPPA